MDNNEILGETTGGKEMENGSLVIFKHYVGRKGVYKVTNQHDNPDFIYIKPVNKDGSDDKRRGWKGSHTALAKHLEPYQV